MMSEDALFKVLEKVDGAVVDEITTGPYREGGRLGRRTWNDKKRVYHDLPQARVYKKRLLVQGRDAFIMKYEPTGIVE